MFQPDLVGHPSADAREIIHRRHRIKLPDGSRVNLFEAHLVQSRAAQIGVVSTARGTDPYCHLSMGTLIYNQL
jgi:hypothetical protein